MARRCGLQHKYNQRCFMLCLEPLRSHHYKVWQVATVSTAPGGKRLLPSPCVWHSQGIVGVVHRAQRVVGGTRDGGRSQATLADQVTPGHRGWSCEFSLASQNRATCGEFSSKLGPPTLSRRQRLRAGKSAPPVPTGANPELQRGQAAHDPGPRAGERHVRAAAVFLASQLRPTRLADCLSPELPAWTSIAFALAFLRLLATPTLVGGRGMTCLNRC